MYKRQVDEVHHQLLHLLRVHPSVPYGRPRLRTEPANERLDVGDRSDPVMNEIYLSAARELELDRLADDLLIERVRLGRYGLAVGRRSRDDGQVARAHQRKLQRAGDRRGGQRQRVDFGSQLAQLLLGRHAELLLLVDHEQTEVLELDALAQYLVRADQDVDLAAFDLFENCLLYTSDAADEL